MATAFEQQILHGGLPTSGPASSSSPRRTPSPSTSDELGSDLSDGHGAAAAAAPSSLGLSMGQPRPQGPQTGVKGVKADAKAYRESSKQRKSALVNGINKRMESMALGRNRTWKEDDEDRAQRAAAAESGGGSGRSEGNASDDDEELDDIRAKRVEEIKSTQAASNEARRKRLAGEDVDNPPKGLSPNLRPKGLFGHLREVGPGGYAQAIDGENGATMIVVHIYVKHVHACAQLTTALSLLARTNPSTKFLSVRAGSIGFGQNGAGQWRADESIDEDEDDEAAEDIVPTILIYQAGKLVANLVRCDLDDDWGHGEERDVRNILARYGAVAAAA